jgi:pSer/pThr/pTyr-binding forkhead associated (FHA) protein
MNHSITLMFMSGVDDGKTITLSAVEGDGSVEGDAWMLNIGRHDSRDIRLQRDSFVSRNHALLTLRDGRWWLTDLGSRNGSYLEGDGEDIRISDLVSLEVGQLFKIGRTWMRIQPPGE